MSKAQRILQSAFFALITLAYVYWIFTAKELTVLSIAVSALVCLLFGLLLARAAALVIDSFRGQADMDISRELGRRSLKKAHRHPVLRIAAALIITRVILYAVAYTMHTAHYGYTGGLLETFSIWLNADAAPYLSIADDWYVSSGAAVSNIRLMPFFPIVVRIVNIAFNSTLFSGIFVSTFFTVLAGFLMYELALMDIDRAAAKRSVKYLFMLPAAFLFAAPMGDALFLTLSLASLLMARKKLYALACMCAMLCSFTHLLGLALLAPLLIELIGDAVREKLSGGNVWRFCLIKFPLLLIVPIGYLVFLYINYNVYNDAFMYTNYVNSQFGGGMGWFFATAAERTDYFLDKFVVYKQEAFSLWLPNILYITGALVIVLLSIRPQFRLMVNPSASTGAKLTEPYSQPYMMRASYIVYFLLYYALSVGAAWFVALPRCLTSCFVLPLALCSRERGRITTTIIYGVLIVMQLLYIAAYVYGYPVY